MIITNFQDTLEVGMTVYSKLYGKGMGFIYSLDKDCNQGDCTSTVIYGSGGGNVEIVYLEGSRSTYPECLLRSGSQIGVSDRQNKIDMTTLEELHQQALEVEREANEEQQRKDDAFALEVSQQESKHPTLIPLCEAKGRQAVHVAKNIRKELKSLEGKFSVKSDGNSIDISWTDGASEKQVQDICSKYKNGYFDGYQDLFVYESSPFNKVFGGVQYLFYSRSMSDSARLEMCRLFGEKFDYTPTLEVLKTGTIPDEYRHDWIAFASSYINERSTQGASPKEEVSLQAIKSRCTISEEQHTKTHDKLFVVRFGEQLEREVFLHFKHYSAKFGGFYSRFKKGFLFVTQQDAENFIN